MWLWTLLVVAAIYSTLAVTRVLTDALRARGLLGEAFVVGLLLVVAAIVAQGLKARPRGIEIGIALGVAAVYLLVFVRMALPEERTHLVEYGVVALLIHEALRERSKQGRHVPVPAVLAVAIASVAGLLGEGIQAWLPGRIFDPRDILFNALAAVMAVTASSAIGWSRGLGTPGSEDPGATGSDPLLYCSWQARAD